MVTGIIAEYNPFHNGHKIQIDYARNTLKSDYIVVALSPDYTQRGEIAILSKYERAKIALELGVDLVIQIPINAATDSSLGYAYGGIKVLDSIGIVDTVLFSAEDDDITLLSRIANIELSESQYYIETINNCLKDGLSYPSAREKAIIKLMPDQNPDMLHNILKQPNNILAIEYISALNILKSNMKPLCIKRVFSSYHDTIISNRIASATAIRNAIYEKDFHNIENVVPNVAFIEYKNAKESNLFLHPNDASQMLGYKMLEGDLTKYKDCNDELSNKINNELSNYTNITDFRSLIKSKNITESRISRVLCHILLNITDELYIDINNKIYPYIPYIFVLGFNDKGLELMSKIKESSKLPYFTSIKDALEYDFDQKSKAVLEADIYATKVYNIILANKTSSNIQPEQSRKFLKVKKATH